MELSGKKIIVTGADGFIGSHLVEALVDQGCQVTALAYYNSFGSWGWLDSLEERYKKSIRVLLGDIRDAAFIETAISGSSVVFHLAALIAIPYSYHAPASFVETNINGTLNVLQACRRTNPDRILITSTSEVYGTAEYVPIDERHPLKGQSPYSATKIGADKLAEAFMRSFDLPVTVVRPFNTYGPRQSARAIIPTIITQLLAGRLEICLGNIDSTRDFNFVKDTVHGFVEIAKSEKTMHEVINIATESEVSMANLAQTLIDLIRPEAKVVFDKERTRPANSEVDRLLGANTKLKNLTNWQMQHDLRTGLEKTIEWFKESKNLNLYKAEIYNV